MKNPNDLVNELHDAAVGIVQEMASGEHANPSIEALERLFFAVDALERGVIVDGVWRLESVIDGDIPAITRLLNQAVSKPPAQSRKG